MPFAIFKNSTLCHMVQYKPVQRMAHFQPVLFLIHIRNGTFSTSYTTYLYNEWLNFNSCIPCKEILLQSFFFQNSKGQTLNKDWTLEEARILEDDVLFLEQGRCYPYHLFFLVLVNAIEKHLELLDCNLSCL